MDYCQEVTYDNNLYRYEYKMLHFFNHLKINSSFKTKLESKGLAFKKSIWRNKQIDNFMIHLKIAHFCYTENGNSLKKFGFL